MKEKERNREVLEKAIKDMKPYEAPEFLWTKIERELPLSNELNKKVLADAITDLPKLNIETELWSQIESSLEKDKSRELINFQTIRRIAAALIIVFGLSFFIKSQIQKRGKIEISTVIVDDKLFQTEVIINNCSTNQKEIDKLCSALPESCESSLVKELKEQLYEVTLEYEELKNMIIDNPEPELVKYLNRIENEKCKIENELLKIIVNS